MDKVLEGQHLTCTVGIPGCGKSTWANEQVAGSYGHIVKVERDELRATCHTSTGNLWDYKYSKTKENAVTALQEIIIRRELAAGNSVIVSDTNLNEKTRTRLAIIARDHHMDINWKVFDVPLHQCMKWNSRRPNHVPESVLIRMEINMRKYLGKYLHDKTNPLGLPECVIFDVDGTLADMVGIRGPFEWDKVGLDKKHGYVCAYFQMLKYFGTTIIVFSGRDGVCYHDTAKWLVDGKVEPTEMYLREAGDQRNDSIIKEELFDKYIKGRYHVSHIVDDRKQVMCLWESMGFQTMNVGGFLADF